MPRAFGNAIAEIISAPGTGAFNLGTVAPGCNLFSTAKEADGTAILTGSTVKCASLAIDANGNPGGGLEIGIYTFTAGSPSTLTRTTIIESSNGGAAVNFTGNVRVELIGFVAADLAAPELPSFAGSALPATPAEGLRLFSQRRGGRDNAAMRGSSGMVRTLMEQIGTAGIRWAVAGFNATAMSVAGFTFASTGTATSRFIATTSLFLSAGRVGNVSAGTAGSAAGFRSTNTHCLRGDAAGIGGFYCVTRFGVAAFTSDSRGFCGVFGGTTIANVDPSTLANIFGIGWDAADSNLQLLHNDAAGLATKVDLGTDFPAKTTATDLYEFRFGCAPNGTTIEWSLERLNTGNFLPGIATGNLPVGATPLAWQLWINNGATASAVGVDLCSMAIFSPV